MFTSHFLSQIRAKALRRRVLYCALDDVERGILYLSGRVVDRVRSVDLCAQLLEIVAKLSEAMRSRFDKHVGSFGLRQAVKMVQTALGFGSKVAREWLNDISFARYLAFLDFNSSKIFLYEK